jgi:hypothetical protein
MDENSREYKLAVELAEALHDTDSLLFYQNLVKIHSESFLRDLLAKVLAIPNEKIRKTRGALFNYMVQQHAHKKRHYSRD